MQRPVLNDLAAFAAVARCRSFTAAAAEMGVSPSALSHAMRGLEARLGVRLLARTTRSVAATEAGRQLLARLGPALEQIDAGLEALSDWRDRPDGVIRLTTFHWLASGFLARRLPAFLALNPGIRVEVTVEDGFQDIVARGFDAGLRFGDDVEKDMIALRVGPPLHHVVAATSAYWAARGRPDHPRDLRGHACVGYHNLSDGTVMAWEFEKDGRPLRQRVTGQMICNSVDLALAVVRSGQGVGLFMRDDVEEALKSGALEQVLADWCPPFSGIHLYYPNRRQTPPALRHLIDFLQSRSDWVE